MNVNVDDRARNDKIIIQTFMKELCRRDDEANRNMDMENINNNHNEFKVRDIHEAVLSAYKLEIVLDAMQRFEMDTTDPFLEFGGQNRSELVHLTNSGRAHCGEFGL